MKPNENNERSSVRVPVYFPLRYRPLAEPSDWEVEAIRHHRTCDRFGAPPTAFTDLPGDLNDLNEFQEMQPTLFRMWMSLERKMDHLIWQENRAAWEETANTFEGRCVDLAAGGAGISLTDPPAVGRRLILRIAPPTFPPFLLETAAEVVRHDPDPTDPSRTLVSTSFVAINDHDREDLISYLFKRQREILRMGQEYI